MSADERREHMLAAALRAFARGGYAGTSTDAVAREAGVSQPYVVRLFGTKLELFLEVFEHAADRIAEAFAAVVADDFDPQREEDRERLGAAYGELVADRDFLLVLMHGFTASGEERIGECARRGMGRIFSILRDGGMDADAARDFVAQGMLLNVLVAMRAPEHVAEGGGLAELAECAFTEKLAAVASLP